MLYGDTGFREAPVIVAGAGPTGLTLAAELRRGGAEVLLLERRPERGVDGSRAAGMQPRTIEMLDQRGIVDPFLAAPQMQMGNFSGIMLDYSAIPSRFPYTLNIMQIETETLLEESALELGVAVQWSTEVTGIAQDGDGVDVVVNGPNGIEVLRGSYLAACDGGKSTIRRLTGVAFPGTDATMVSLIGDVQLDEPPEHRMFLDRRELGAITAVQFRPGWYRVTTTERQRVGAGPKDAVTLDELAASARRVAGTDFGMHSATWLSHFNDAVRQAEHYRLGRVLLAGDAAHIQLPAGGQGMNMGMQDAFNLGWKLAAVLRGDAPDRLLDTYHEERHAVDEGLLNLIRAQSVLLELGQPTYQLYKVFTRLIGFDDVNRYLSAVLSGLDVHYPMGDGHPMVGRRIPDVRITPADTDTDTRVFELLNPARPVLLDLSGTPERIETLAGWADRIDVVAARGTLDHWDLPAVGPVTAPSALLIRPDGYVAWASDGLPDWAGFRQALATWCGPAKSTAPLLRRNTR